MFMNSFSTSADTKEALKGSPELLTEGWYVAPLLATRSSLIMPQPRPAHLFLLRLANAPCTRAGDVADGGRQTGGRRAASCGYWLTGARGGREVVQNKVPKIDAETLKPCKWPANPGKEWCPPGHGDLYPALAGTGMLDKLLKDGVKYMFVSNSDNLGATLDLQLLNYFAEVLLLASSLPLSRSAAPCAVS